MYCLCSATRVIPRLYAVLALAEMLELRLTDVESHRLGCTAAANNIRASRALTQRPLGERIGDVAKYQFSSLSQGPQDLALEEAPWRFKMFSI